MIVEPTPTSPRSPLRRALRIGGIVLPVTLLAAVVGAGLLGPRPEPVPPPAASEPAAVAPSPSGTPGPTPDTVSGMLAGLPPPDAFGGLPAISTTELLAVRTGGVTPVAVAVMGFLRIDGAAEDCATLPGGALGPWCERRGSLGDRPWASAGFGGGRQPHLHVTIPAGVRLPERLTASGDEPGEGGLRVLVVGRFADDAEPCTGIARSCDDGFVVERVAWADGARMGLTPLVDPRLETGTKRPNPFQVVADQRALPMAAALVWPDGVARLDPGAAALASEGPRSEPVWYVRLLARGGEGGAETGFSWLLLAERDLRVLGTGPVGVRTIEVTSPVRFPASVASLRVRRVPAALAALGRGERRRIVAVAGYLAAWAVPRDCVTPIPGMTGVGCKRRAILTEEPWARTGTAGMGGVGAVMEAIVPAGVTVPEAALGLVVAKDDPPPVVVIGWFADAGDPCPIGRPSCGTRFTIERIIWASGQRMEIGHQVADPLAVDVDDPMVVDRARSASRALGPITMLLRLALVDRDALGGLDATAAAGLRGRGPLAGEGPVWYLRGVDIPYDPLPDPPYGRREATVRWAVVDQATGQVLVSGVEPPGATGETQARRPDGSSGVAGPAG